MTLGKGKWFTAFANSEGVNVPTAAASKHQDEVGRPGVGKRSAQLHPEHICAVFPEPHPGAPGETTPRT